MRLLITADLHSRLDWYHSLEKMATNFDALIIAGDLVDMLEPGIEEQRAFVELFVDRIEERGTRVFVCEGNHDTSPSSWLWLQSRLGLHELPEITLSCLAWGEPNLEVLDRHRSVSQARGVPWIVLQHNPPLGSLVGTGQNENLCPQLHSLAWQPHVICCGHIHYAPMGSSRAVVGSSTWNLHL